MSGKDWGLELLAAKGALNLVINRLNLNAFRFNLEKENAFGSAEICKGDLKALREAYLTLENLDLERRSANRRNLDLEIICLKQQAALDRKDAELKRINKKLTDLQTFLNENDNSRNFRSRALFLSVPISSRQNTKLRRTPRNA